MTKKEIADDREEKGEKVKKRVIIKGEERNEIRKRSRI